MKEIKFRPLRRIKKTGKITVASYMGWNNVKVADYSEFKLVVLNDYKDFPPNEFVYNHEGKQLFFYTYKPDDIPVERHTILWDTDSIDLDNLEPRGDRGVQWSAEGSTHYMAKGMDCAGTPCFSHYTADYIATHYKDMSQFEPLTVKTVVYWFGWFLYELQRSHLQIG